MKEVNHLVLSGGGIRGVASLGALKRITEACDLKLQSIMGVSVGSVIGLMYLVGYTPTEFIDVVLEKDMKELVDVSISNMFTHYGIDSTEKVIEWIQELIEAKGMSKDITFSELYLKTGITFKVAATNLTKNKQVIFDHESYPELSVVSAVIMSCSVPFIFACKNFEGDIYVDGALIDNFPMELYKDVANSTIGIQLTSSEGKDEPVNSLHSYIKRVMYVINSNCETASQERNVIVLDTKGVSSFNFNVSKHDKKDLVYTGYTAATLYLDSVTRTE